MTLDRLLLLKLLVTRLPSLIDAVTRASAVAVALLSSDKNRRNQARLLIRTIASPTQRTQPRRQQD